VAKKRGKSGPDNTIERDLNAAFPPEWLRKTAVETKFVERERKIDPVVFFWVLVMGFGVKLQGHLAGLKRSYEKVTGESLADSAWYVRFSPELVDFLHACVQHGIETLSQESNRVLAERLKWAEDILIQDTSVVRVNAALASKFAATRTRKLAAGVKVSLLVSAVSDGPKRVAIVGERTAEINVLKIGPWVKDRIILMDLGYYKHQGFARIQENGGYFLSRLKDSANPEVLKLERVVRGNSVPVLGERIQDVLPRLQREVLDCTVRLTFRRRAYAGKSTGDEMSARVVAIRDEETNEYHTYVTNIPTEKLTAEEIAKLYAARWHVELVFKELKSRYALDVLPTKNVQVITAYIWIAILTLLVSRRIYHLVRQHAGPKMTLRYTQVRWSKIFSENADDQLRTILAYIGIEISFMTKMDIYSSQALDPHVNRERLRDVWEA
jgi:putative transposase